MHKVTKWEFFKAEMFTRMYKFWFVNQIGPPYYTRVERISRLLWWLFCMSPVVILAILVVALFQFIGWLI